MYVSMGELHVATFLREYASVGDRRLGVVELAPCRGLPSPHVIGRPLPRYAACKTVILRYASFVFPLLFVREFFCVAF